MYSAECFACVSPKPQVSKDNKNLTIQSCLSLLHVDHVDPVPVCCWMSLFAVHYVFSTFAGAGFACGSQQFCPGVPSNGPGFKDGGEMADITMGSSKHLQFLQSHSGCIVDTLQGSCCTAVRKRTTAANNQLKQDLEDQIEFATKEMNQ